jgi:hypothetical protein
MSMTNFLGDKVLDLISMRANSVASTSAVYAGLSTTEPTVVATSNWGVTEPVGHGYARTLIGYYNQSATYKLTAASGGACANTGITIFFNKLTGTGAEEGWGACGWLVLFDALTTGNVIAFGALTAPITPVTGEVPIIESGQLTLTLA